MYTKGEPNKEVKAFLDYMVTDDVQKTIVKDLGYLAITDMQVERDVNGFYNHLAFNKKRSLKKLSQSCLLAEFFCLFFSYFSIYISFYLHVCDGFLGFFFC
jgi:hypothetical protein